MHYERTYTDEALAHLRNRVHLTTVIGELTTALSEVEYAHRRHVAQGIAARSRSELLQGVTEKLSGLTSERLTLLNAMAEENNWLRTQGFGIEDVAYIENLEQPLALTESQGA